MSAMALRHLLSSTSTKTFELSVRDRLARHVEDGDRLRAVLLSGRTTQRLLQGLVLDTLPVRSRWTRQLLRFASHLACSPLRAELSRICYEEDSADLTTAQGHLEALRHLGRCVGLLEADFKVTEELPRIDDLAGDSPRAAVHLTALLTLIEAELLSLQGTDLAAVMRDGHGLPAPACDAFVTRAQRVARGFDRIHDEQEGPMARLLEHYLLEPEEQATALREIDRVLARRNHHVDAIVRRYFDSSEPPFSHGVVVWNARRRPDVR